MSAKNYLFWHKKRLEQQFLLYQTYASNMVGTTRFELVVFCSQSRRDNQATLRPERPILSPQQGHFSRGLLAFDGVGDHPEDEPRLNDGGQNGLGGEACVPKIEGKENVNRQLRGDRDGEGQGKLSQLPPAKVTLDPACARQDVEDGRSEGKGQEQTDLPSFPRRGERAKEGR